MRTTEHWQDGNLVSATSKANNDGKPESMTAKLQGDALAVQGSKSGHYTAPPGAILATHWNRAELKGPMINPENGELMTFTIAGQGDRPDPGGRANHPGRAICPDRPGQNQPVV